MTDKKAGLLDDGYCFACGKDNPWGLHMTVEFTEQEVLCRINLPNRFQGWRGIAHGGIVATLLDEVMAHAVVHFKGSGVTASMQTRYKSPVPLEKDLLVKGWVEKNKGRIVETNATISLENEESVLAHASAKFLLSK